MSSFLRQVPGTRDVTLIKNLGEPDEQRFSLKANIQSKQGMFEVDAPINEGDVVELPDPRGGLRQLKIAKIDIHDLPGIGRGMNHLTAHWGPPPPQLRQSPIRRLGLEGLHPAILAAASKLFTDGHYAAAIFEAFKAVELRVRSITGIEESGTQLMGRAFSGSPAPIVMATERGRSGKDEQEGFKLLFIGAMQGIRNPKGHEAVTQQDPQRALEYLAFASLLMRRLDDATDSSLSLASDSPAPT
jgi:uncharacterized protein (TIGR02391 family)